MATANTEGAAKRAQKTGGRAAPAKKRLIKLDIACGQRKGDQDPQTGSQDPEGWIGIDIAKTDAADIVHDLNVYPWPIGDESVERARCSHYVEHIPHDIGHPEGLDGFIAFVNELYRVMAPGGTVEVWCPYYSSSRAVQDPTHHRFISEGTFLYCNQEWMRNNGLDHYGVTADFDFSWGYLLHDDPQHTWHTAHEEKRQFGIEHYMNVVDDIYFTLTKR